MHLQNTDDTSKRSITIHIVKVSISLRLQKTPNLHQEHQLASETTDRRGRPAANSRHSTAWTAVTVEIYFCTLYYCSKFMMSIRLLLRAFILVYSELKKSILLHG